jgi:hypothetical protein
MILIIILLHETCGLYIAVFKYYRALYSRWSQIQNIALKHEALPLLKR